MAATPRLGLDYLVAGQASAEITVNGSLNRLDTFVQGSVLSDTTIAEPGSPGTGDRYIVPTSATGTNWSGKDGKIAYYFGGWLFVTPKVGMTLWVEDTQSTVHYNGTAWMGLDPRAPYHYYRQVGAGQDRWYMAGMGGNGTALGTATPSLGTLYALPFVSQRAGVIDRIGLCVTAGAGGAKARVCGYTCANDTDLYPTAIVPTSDVAELDVSGTGVISNSLILPVMAGRLYWLAVNFGVAAPTVRALAAANTIPILGLDNAFGTGAGVGWTVASSYGAMPSTFPGSATILSSAGTLPAIGVRFSA